MSETAVEVKNLVKSFWINTKQDDSIRNWTKNIFFGRRFRTELKVLQGLSFQIRKGETFGIIGQNGSGKSTLSKLIAGVYVPTNGRITNKGQVIMLGLRVGFNSELTTRQNIYLSASALGLTIREIDSIFDSIVDFAELEEFVHTKIKYFSPGMNSRLAYSIAINAKADILILDEVFAVGDKRFREKAVKSFEKNWIEGKTTIMVSHSMPHVKKYCDRVLYLKDGQIEYLGDPDEAVARYEADN